MRNAIIGFLIGLGASAAAIQTSVMARSVPPVNAVSAYQSFDLASGDILSCAGPNDVITYVVPIGSTARVIATIYGTEATPK